jgi:hypothetical protein
LTGLLHALAFDAAMLGLHRKHCVKLVLCFGCMHVVCCGWLSLWILFLMFGVCRSVCFWSVIRSKHLAWLFPAWKLEAGVFPVQQQHAAQQQQQPS